MAVAMVALLVALGGTAGAAVLISGKQLRNRSVSGKKLKINTLTSKEVSESRLKAVPRARVATIAGVAGSVSGNQIRKIHLNAPNGTDDTVVLDMLGLQVIAACPGGNARLLARSLANNADLRIGVLSGKAPNAAVSGTANFDIGTSIDMRAGKPTGVGTLVYNRREGQTITVTYSFAGARTLGGFRGCAFAGMATGG
jgi:hypothetical protein